MDQIVACHLGRVEYGVAWTLQQAIQTRLVAAHRSEASPAPHVLLLVEHPPVITLGKSGDDGNLLLDETALNARGIAFYRIDRGGDITYHGPGQLVAYPIFDLNRFYTDVHRYLRDLEEAVIGVCATYGIRTGRVEGRTGVWVLPDARGPERKICAMGIRVSRWVTMHGLALNVSTNLTHFDLIVPCGINDRGVTSIALEVQTSIDETEVARILEANIGRAFDRPVTRLDPDASRTFLAELLGDTHIDLVNTAIPSGPLRV